MELRGSRCRGSPCWTAAKATRASRPSAASPRPSATAWARPIISAAAPAAGSTCCSKPAGGSAGPRQPAGRGASRPRWCAAPGRTAATASRRAARTRRSRRACSPARPASATPGSAWRGRRPSLPYCSSTERMKIMPERKPTGLDYLIHPFTAEEFVEHWFEQRWLHVHREDRGHFAGLFSFMDMDRIIAHGDLQADYTLTLVKGDVAIHKLGQSGRQDYRGGHDLKEASLSPDGIYREVADGNTVRISFTERFSHPVWEMAGELERQLNANIV